MKELNFKVDENIKAPEVRVIDENGQHLGVMPREKALELARSKGLNLIQINEAKPPVCKIADWGKFLYEQKKRLKELKRREREKQADEIKEIYFRVRIDKHDFDIKVSKMREWIEEDNAKVRVGIRARGREIEHPELMQQLLDRIKKELEDIAKCEKSSIEGGGRIMIAIFSPLSKKKGKRQED